MICLFHTHTLTDFIQISELKFTAELNIIFFNPFLDVLTDSNNNEKFITSLYKKINQLQLHFTEVS